jgi:AcrR family transcriptional regulator
MSRDAQKDRSEAVRGLIIQTTIEIMKESGIEAVSIRNIANRMGYTPGVIYYHFKNKQEIIDTVHGMANQEVIQIIKNRSDVEKKEDRGTIENIKSVFYEVMKIAMKDKDIFDLIMIDKYSVRNESINPWLGMIEVALQEGVNKGELKKINVKQVAFCLWSAYVGFFYMIGKDNDIKIEDTEEIFNTMTQMMAKGIEIDSLKEE